MTLNQLINYIETNDLKLFVGLRIEKRQGLKNPIRFTPFSEITCFSLDQAEKIRSKLLFLGVSSTIHKKGVRINGVKNCLMIQDLFNDCDWWKKCIGIMEKGDHLKKKGAIKMLLLHEKGAKVGMIKNCTDDLIQLVMDKY